MNDFLNFIILRMESLWSRITCYFYDKNHLLRTCIIKYLSSQKAVIYKKRMLENRNFCYPLNKNAKLSNYERIKSILFEVCLSMIKQKRLILIRNLARNYFNAFIYLY